MATLKIKLNSKDINDTIKQLKSLSKSKKTISDKAIKTLSEKTLDVLKDYYNMGLYENSHSEPTFTLTKTDKGYRISASSKDIVYEEFGTGDVGKANPHPEKSKYNLNAYNSGKTIKKFDSLSEKQKYLVKSFGISGGNVWFYKDTITGKRVATRGIPAGKFMYNTDTWLKENYKKIIKEEVGDALSKLKIQ